MNIDWNRIKSFITEGDEEEEAWLREMIQTLISNFEELLIELEELMNKRDNYKLSELLHQMKGTASNFGLIALGKVIVQSEKYTKEDNIDLAIKEISNFKPVWTKTKEELKTKLGI